MQFHTFSNTKMYTVVAIPILISVDVVHNGISILTFRPPSTTIVSYANSLDLDETPSNSASHPDSSCLALRQHFHQL